LNRPAAKFSEEIMNLVEKQLAQMPVENRPEMLMTLLRDVKCRLDMELEIPGISKGKVRKLTAGAVKQAEKAKEIAIEKKDEHGRWLKSVTESKSQPPHGHKNTMG
jgi:hypothetical protein